MFPSVKRAAALLLALALALGAAVGTALADDSLRQALAGLSDDELLALLSAATLEAEARGLSLAPSAADKASQPLAVTVYVSKSGKKYHRKPTCSNMKSPLEISLEEAIESGYGPCKKCY